MRDPRCKYCQQPILWVKTWPGEQLMPVDPTASPTGAYQVDWDATPMPRAERIINSWRGLSEGYNPHRASCRARQHQPTPADDETCS